MLVEWWVHDEGINTRQKETADSRASGRVTGGRMLGNDVCMVAAREVHPHETIDVDNT